MTMPFGKHRGVSLRELPSDYLAWLLGLALREPLARPSPPRPNAVSGTPTRRRPRTRPASRAMRFPMRARLSVAGSALRP